MVAADMVAADPLLATIAMKRVICRGTAPKVDAVVEVAATATTAANLDIFRAIAPRPDPAVAAAAATPFSATNVVVMVISPAIAPTKWHRQLLHSLLMAALERFFFFSSACFT